MFVSNDIFFNSNAACISERKHRSIPRQACVQDDNSENESMLSNISFNCSIKRRAWTLMGELTGKFEDPSSRITSDRVAATRLFASCLLASTHLNRYVKKYFSFGANEITLKRQTGQRACMSRSRSSVTQSTQNSSCAHGFSMQLAGLERHMQQRFSSTFSSSGHSSTA